MEVMSQKHKENIIAHLRQGIMDAERPCTNQNKTKIPGLGAIEKAFSDLHFPISALHEFVCISPECTAATEGFLGGVISHLLKDGGIGVWISNSRKLFPVALNLFNVAPDSIVFIDTAQQKDALWACEEALKCEGLAFVVAELEELNITASRRLQLAIEKSHATAFILRKTAKKALINSATARWKVSPVSSVVPHDMPGIGHPRWQVELLKVRGGVPGQWTVVWQGDKFVESKYTEQSVADNFQKFG